MWRHGGHSGCEFLAQKITAILIDRDIPWEFNSIFMQTSPLFSINQYDHLSRERNYPKGKIYCTRGKLEKRKFLRAHGKPRSLSFEFNLVKTDVLQFLTLRGFGKISPK